MFSEGWQRKSVDIQGNMLQGALNDLKGLVGAVRNWRETLGGLWWGITHPLEQDRAIIQGGVDWAKRLWDAWKNDPQEAQEMLSQGAGAILVEYLLAKGAGAASKGAARVGAMMADHAPDLARAGRIISGMVEDVVEEGRKVRRIMGRTIKEIVDDDARFKHTFNRHAHEWWGLQPDQVKASTHGAEWRKMLEKTLRSNVQLDWTLEGTPTRLFLARFEGRWFAVQIFTEGDYAGRLGSAFAASAEQMQNWGRILGWHK
jgi:hypothetical protein